MKDGEKVTVESSFELHGFKKYVSERDTHFENGERVERIVYQLPPEKVMAAVERGGKIKGGEMKPCPKPVKKKRRKRGYSESVLLDLFRKAVKALRGEVCLRCIEEGVNERRPVQIHHIVHRSFLLLKYDPENGLPLCAEHHAWADTGAGREWCRSKVDKVYLDQRQAYGNIKAYFTELGTCRQDWIETMKNKLAGIVT
jgi:hypothetical protein